MCHLLSAGRYQKEQVTRIILTLNLSQDKINLLHLHLHIEACCNARSLSVNLLMADISKIHSISSAVLVYKSMLLLAQQ